MLYPCVWISVFMLACLSVIGWAYHGPVCQNMPVTVQWCDNTCFLNCCAFVHHLVSSSLGLNNVCQTENETLWLAVSTGLLTVDFWTFSSWLCPLRLDGRLSFTAKETPLRGSCQKPFSFKKTAHQNVVPVYCSFHIFQLQFCLKV